MGRSQDVVQWYFCRLQFNQSHLILCGVHCYFQAMPWGGRPTAERRKQWGGEVEFNGTLLCADQCDPTQSWNQCCCLVTPVVSLECHRALAQVALSTKKFVGVWKSCKALQSWFSGRDAWYWYLTKKRRMSEASRAWAAQCVVCCARQGCSLSGAINLAEI